ncbi:phosphohydrolase [Reyranella sp.]|uniref:phosphohydrolase n=1 Tax=Reyranella sp. TaxID=1929291 RepID=UPI003C7D35AE
MDYDVPNSNVARVGDWMMTYTGRKFFPLDPRPEDIDLRDIGWGLAHQCRYNGHGRFFYSVAEHSVLLSNHFGQGMLAREALLHDAAEAYIGDVIRPLKRSLPQFVEIEAKLERVIFKRFNLPATLRGEIKAADTSILTDERNRLFDAEVCEAHGWTVRDRLGVPIDGWSPTAAYGMFMQRALALGLLP